MSDNEKVEPSQSIDTAEKPVDQPSHPQAVYEDLATSSDPPSDSSAQFQPGWRFYTSFVSLCTITLAAAFDATSISVALPVRVEFPFNLFYA